MVSATCALARTSTSPRAFLSKAMPAASFQRPGFGTSAAPIFESFSASAQLGHRPHQPHQAPSWHAQTRACLACRFCRRLRPTGGADCRGRRPWLPPIGGYASHRLCFCPHHLCRRHPHGPQSERWSSRRGRRLCAVAWLWHRIHPCVLAPLCCSARANLKLSKKNFYK